MNKIDLMELLKSGGLTDVFALLKHAKIVSYGVITEVVDAQTVRVTEVVQSSAAGNVCLATVMVPSSALFEAAVLPQSGDLVLLLFLQKYRPAMFDLHREPKDAVLYDEKAEGYNGHSAVAVPLSPPKGASATAIRFDGTAARSVLSLATAAEITAQFKKSLTAFFDGEGAEAAPVSLLFGALRPLLTEHWGQVCRRYGFRTDTVDKTLLETDAAVEEQYSVYAPIRRDVQGSQTTDVGLGTDPGGDPEGSPVETAAPITGTVHGKSPVTLDLRSPVTATIGIGNAESGDAAEQRDAAVSVELGEQAPIALTSASGMTLHFDKPVVLDGDETFDMTFDGKMTIEGKDQAEVTVTKEIVVTGKDTAEMTITKKITVTGGAQITIEAGNKLFIGNGTRNLYAALTELVKQIKDLVLFGQPGIHKVTPVSKLALDLYRQQYIEPFLTDSK